MLKIERILLWMLAGVVVFLIWQNHKLEQNAEAQGLYNEDIGNCTNMVLFGRDRGGMEQCGVEITTGSRGWESMAKAILAEKAKEEAEQKALVKSLKEQEEKSRK